MASALMDVVVRHDVNVVTVGPSPCYIDSDDYIGGFDEADIHELLDSLASNYLGWSSARRRGRWCLSASIVSHAGSAGSLAEGLVEDVLFLASDPRDDIAIVAVQVP